jgi:molybdenum cofactor cytidylyltransferase
MGAAHKLLLPWKGKTVIDQVLQAWTQSTVDRVVVVVRGDNTELQTIVGRWPAVDVLVPNEQPDDMKRSIQLGLDWVADHCEPAAADRWITAPADLPTLSTPLIDRLIESGRASDQILAPRFGGRSGHPVCFPWALVPEVFRLGASEGLNRLLAEHAVRWLDLAADEHPRDLDTPSDYLRLRQAEEAE